MMMSLKLLKANDKITGIHLLCFCCNADAAVNYNHG